MKLRTLTVLAITAMTMSVVACSPKGDQSEKLAYHHIDETPRTKHKDLAKAARLNVQLGMAYLKTGKMQRAKSKLLTAMEQAPKNALVYDAMAYYQEMTGDLKEADAFYKKALKLEPSNGTPLNNYGGFLCRQRRFKESLPYFIEATKDPSYLKVADAYENAGLCALEVPDPAKAREYFMAAMRNDPRRTLSLYELAELDYKAGDLKKAANEIENYMTMAGPDPVSTLLAYKINKRLHRNDEAAKYAKLMHQQFAKTKQFEQFRQFRGSRIS